MGEFTISRLPADHYNVILGLDRILFPHDIPPYFKTAMWWIVWNKNKWPIGYGGLVQSYQVSKAGYLCRAGVLPEAQGNGLQKRLIRVREKYARLQGWTEIRTDTAFDNIASMRSLASLGYLPFTPEIEWGVENAIYWQKYL